MVKGDIYKIWLDNLLLALYVISISWMFLTGRNSRMRYKAVIWGTGKQYNSHLNLIKWQESLENLEMRRRPQ